MKLGHNNELINSLSGKQSLTSSIMFKLEISNEPGELVIEMCFELPYSKNNNLLKLRFSGIEEYSFYYNSEYIFYNVEICKFFLVDEKVYISLDPEDETEVISENDQDFILCSKVEGLFYQ